MTIRPLSTREEAVACARLMASSEPWVTLGRSHEAALAILEDAAKESYVSYLPGEGGELSGFMVLDMRGPLAGYIQTVCVAPTHRGRGVGTELVRWAEQRIFAVSPNVFMCVSSFNTRARELYERLGYRQVGELPDHIVAGHSEILLRKSLGPWSAFSLGG